MYGIEFQFELDNAPVPEARMRSAIASVLDREEANSECSLTVVITGDEQVRVLNQKFREVDAPTDILSFPAEPLPELPPELADLNDEPPYLGDLIIAYPYSRRQAEELGHAFDDELVLLVIHGTLHLLGHDHDTADNEDRMWTAQAELLEQAGVSIKVPRFTDRDVA